MQGDITLIKTSRLHELKLMPDQVQPGVGCWQGGWVGLTDQMDPDHLLFGAVADDLILRDGLVARSALQKAHTQCN